MRLAILGGVLLLLGFLAIATGILPPADAAAVGERVWPILLFAVAITVVAELAADAGVFAAVAERTARAARGRAWLLWLFVVLIAWPVWVVGKALEGMLWVLFWPVRAIHKKNNPEEYAAFQAELASRKAAQKAQREAQRGR